MTPKTNSAIDTVHVELENTLREMAKRRLASFCEYEGRGQWVHSPHLDYLCEKVEEAEEWIRGKHDEIKLIIVSMPPRHGKSEVISRHAPAWVLGRNPDWEIILASYNVGLATDMSRDARAIFRDTAAPLFGLELSRETSAASLWHVAEHDGKVQAAGTGGTITGRGAHVAIIDDPIKGMKEAESAVEQESALRWFKSTIIERMAPGGAIIIVATRWTVTDLIGNLLEEAEINDIHWENIKFPAIATEDDILGRKVGEALWPWRYNLKQLEQIRALQANDRYWVGQYQQEPTADVRGAHWTLGLIEALRVASAPTLFRILVSWDPATTSNRKKSDKHGIVVVASGPPHYRPGVEKRIKGPDEKHAYVLEDLSDVYTPQSAAEVVIEAYYRWGAGGVVAEVNQGGEFVETVLRMTDPDVAYTPLTAAESKYSRAETAASLYHQLRAHHVGRFAELEAQQCSYTGPPMPSPDNYDALVHGLTKLFDLGTKKKKKARAL